MYRIIVKKSAEKELDQISQPYKSKIAKAIQALAENPRPQGYKQLKGENSYSIRIADYRVIYAIEDIIKIIEVQKISHRKDVYGR